MPTCTQEYVWPAPAQIQHVLADPSEFIIRDGKRCRIDLSRTDIYETLEVPDSDVETALKVLRTIRTMCLDPLNFEAEGAVLLSHAHAFIAEAVAQVLAAEAREGTQPRLVVSDAVRDVFKDRAHRELKEATVKLVAGLFAGMTAKERWSILGDGKYHYYYLEDSSDNPDRCVGDHQD